MGDLSNVEKRFSEFFQSQSVPDKTTFLQRMFQTKPTRAFQEFRAAYEDAMKHYLNSRWIHEVFIKVRRAEAMTFLYRRIAATNPEAEKLASQLQQEMFAATNWLRRCMQHFIHLSEDWFDDIETEEVTALSASLLTLTNDLLLELTLGPTDKSTHNVNDTLTRQQLQRHQLKSSAAFQKFHATCIELRKKATTSANTSPIKLFREEKQYSTLLASVVRAEAAWRHTSRSDDHKLLHLVNKVSELLKDLIAAHNARSFHSVTLKLSVCINQIGQLCAELEMQQRVFQAVSTDLGDMLTGLRKFEHIHSTGDAARFKAMKTPHDLNLALLKALRDQKFKNVHEILHHNPQVHALVASVRNDLNLRTSSDTPTTQPSPTDEQVMETLERILYFQLRDSRLQTEMEKKAFDLIFPELTTKLIIPAPPWRRKGVTKLGPYGVSANVDIKIKHVEGNHFVVTGCEEETNKGKFQWYLGSSKTELDVMLTMRGKVTVKPAARKTIGIPIDAKTFAWAYPCVSRENVTKQDRDGQSNADTAGKIKPVPGNMNSFDSFLLYGGYVYFGEGGDKDILQCNALWPGSAFQFSAPRQLKRDAYVAFQDLFQKVTLEAVASSGAKLFAWIMPEQCERLDKDFHMGKAPYGAFAYVYPGHEEQNNIFALNGPVVYSRARIVGGPHGQQHTLHAQQSTTALFRETAPSVSESFSGGMSFAHGDGMGTSGIIPDAE